MQVIRSKKIADSTRKTNARLSGASQGNRLGKLPIGHDPVAKISSARRGKWSTLSRSVHRTRSDDEHRQYRRWKLISRRAPRPLVWPATTPPGAKEPILSGSCNCGSPVSSCGNPKYSPGNIVACSRWLFSPNSEFVTVINLWFTSFRFLGFSKLQTLRSKSVGAIQASETVYTPLFLKLWCASNERKAEAKA